MLTMLTIKITITALIIATAIYISIKKKNKAKAFDLKVARIGEEIRVGAEKKAKEIEEKMSIRLREKYSSKGLSRRKDD